MRLARRVVANPLQTEFAESGEEFDREIDLRRYASREPRHWPCGSLERHCCKPCWLHGRLSEPQEMLSYFVKKCMGFSLRSLRRDLRAVSEDTLRYCRVDLGLMEPERSCSNFSWSNSMTSDSTIDPRSLKSTCAMAFSSVEKIFPSWVAIFCWSEKISK